MTHQRQRNVYAFVSFLFLFTPVHAGVVTGVYEYTLSNDRFVVIRTSLARYVVRATTLKQVYTHTLAFKRTFTKSSPARDVKPPKRCRSRAEIFQISNYLPFVIAYLFLLDRVRSERIADTSDRVNRDHGGSV